ncbi:hypothetical protein PSU4_47330 [Pseudonocardia sulfidoxydans NBRC 16205]|uniref:DUF3043 domain-containing protein n=1 Tax=Pseudonocardia sulfidoxydans NBRC 16205 TaxID=1223511 RepID=A0A511DLT7_9PSEU|nr:DUF3043 domain-containing protein [Pseudonocardia sulfidoxydans]GEL25779.1 hypothetical protein PSU4_47330 [Pseudonocardia sulfidoxydans NBRC 16205]
MRFLRRSDESTGTAADTTEGADAGATAEDVSLPKGQTAGKGRATPKRRDAQSAARRPATPAPRTRKEASAYAKANRPTKDARRAAAAERRARMDAGDDRYLLPRDRGPVRAYIRDVIDSRPHLVGMFMPLAILVLIAVVLPVPAIQQYLSLFCLLALVVMIGEGVILALTTTRKARAKFPGEHIGALGTGWYCFTRASQVRKLRVPKPRVQRGATV